MSKHAYYVTVSALIGMLCVTIYFSYLSFYPFKTIVIHDVTASDTKAGDTLYYIVDYCKYTNIPSTVFRTLRAADDTAIIPFPEVTTVAITGCHKVTVPLTIYPNTPAGLYYLQGDAVFHVNQIRDIHIQFRSNNFNVL